jgi:hypothetical protein
MSSNYFESKDLEFIKATYAEIIRDLLRDGRSFEDNSDLTYWEKAMEKCMSSTYEMNRWVSETKRHYIAKAANDAARKAELKVIPEEVLKTRQAESEKRRLEAKVRSYQQSSTYAEAIESSVANAAARAATYAASKAAAAFDAAIAAGAGAAALETLAAVAAAAKAAAEVAAEAAAKANAVYKAKAARCFY